MRRFFGRSTLWLLPAVLIPLAVLLVMQYRSLRRLEEATASAERNRIRASLEKVVGQVEASYRTAAMKALTLDGPTLANVNVLGSHFAKNKVPGARTYFAIRYNVPKTENGYFDRDGRERTVSATQEDEAIKMATVGWWMAHRMARIVPTPSLHVDERDPDHRIILRAVTDDSMHVIGVVGVVLDQATAKATIERMAIERLRSSVGSHDLTVRVGETFPKMARGDYITQAMGFVFTNWRIGLRDICASPEEIAAYHFRVNLISTGIAALLLLSAIGLAIQATFRQMRVSQMKSEFVSNVSHELRTPLSSIRVFGEYMRLGRVEKPEKIREYGEYIEVESRRLTQLINNILDFSKIESAEKKYRFCEGDVGELVHQLVGAVELPLRDQGFTVQLQTPQSPLPPVHMDKDALSQALLNLIDNAVKYSRERKEVSVRVFSGEHDVRIAVQDRGIGIPAREQKKIFEKFYRVGSGLVHDVKGSGLGLAIVSHIVKAHGGRVEVSSTSGEGSTFTIVLPIAPEQAPLMNEDPALLQGS